MAYWIFLNIYFLFFYNSSLFVCFFVTLSYFSFSLSLFSFFSLMLLFPSFFCPLLFLSFHYIFISFPFPSALTLPFLFSAHSSYFLFSITLHLFPSFIYNPPSLLFLCHFPVSLLFSALLLFFLSFLCHHPSLPLSFSYFFSSPIYPVFSLQPLFSYFFSSTTLLFFLSSITFLHFLSFLYHSLLLCHLLFLLFIWHPPLQFSLSPSFTSFPTTFLLSLSLLYFPSFL